MKSENTQHQRAQAILEDQLAEKESTYGASRSALPWITPEILTVPLNGSFSPDVPHQNPATTLTAESPEKPYHRLGHRSYTVANEMVLLPPPSSHRMVISLNQSARAIWELCDGQRTQQNILDSLRQRYDQPRLQIAEHLSTALRTFNELSLFEMAPKVPRQRPPVKFVVGIEDRTIFHWQLPIFIESLREQLPSGWEILVVICNNHETLSETLSHIIQTYGIRYFTTTNHPYNHSIDFSTGQDRYVPINRIQALSAVAEYVQPDDLVCLMETDIFLYQELNLDVIPTGNALSKNWIVGKERFFTFREESKGVNLQKLLEALDCVNDFQPGGVIIFLTGATIKNEKFIHDCFRFTQILYLMGRILEVHKVWVAEMPSVALSMTLNAIPYDLLNESEFTTQNVATPAINPGSFYHYYHDLMDGGDGAFYQSKWYKQLFKKENFLKSDIRPYSSAATTDHEKYFFHLVERAQRRLYAFHA